MAAKNDHLIHEVVANPDYYIGVDGLIFYCGHEIGYNNGGYIYFTYRRKSLPVHRAVWLMWMGNLDPEMEINHRDFDKANNALHNLEMITPAENKRHAHAAGRFPGGCPEIPACAPAAKLTYGLAEEIRELAATGLSRKELALRFGVSQAAISRVISRETWKDPLHAKVPG